MDRAPGGRDGCQPHENQCLRAPQPQLIACHRNLLNALACFPKRKINMCPTPWSASKATTAEQTLSTAAGRGRSCPGHGGPTWRPCSPAPGAPNAGRPGRNAPCSWSCPVSPQPVELERGETGRCRTILTDPGVGGHGRADPRGGHAREHAGTWPDGWFTKPHRATVLDRQGLLGLDVLTENRKSISTAAPPSLLCLRGPVNSSVLFPVPLKSPTRMLGPTQLAEDITGRSVTGRVWR